MEFDRGWISSMMRGLGDGTQNVVRLFGLDPEIIGRLVDRALALSDAGKFDQAEGLLIDLVDLAPLAAGPLCLLGECRFKRGDLQGALRAFSESIERASSAESGQIAQAAYGGRAQVLMAMNEVDLACSDLEKVKQGADKEWALFATRAIDALGKRRPSWNPE